MVIVFKLSNFKLLTCNCNTKNILICFSVTCKNCTLTVECQNCTQSHKDTQSTIPMHTSTQNNQQLTSSPLPTPIIQVAPNNPSSPSQSQPTTVTSGASTNTSANPQTSPPSPTAGTKSISDGNQVRDDGTNLTTDAVNEGVTGGDGLSTT